MSSRCCLCVRVSPNNNVEGILLRSRCPAKAASLGCSNPAFRSTFMSVNYYYNKVGTIILAIISRRNEKETLNAESLLEYPNTK